MPAHFDLSIKEMAAVLFVTIGTALIIYDIRGIILSLRVGGAEDARLIVKGIRVFTTLTGMALLVAGNLYGNNTLFLLGLVLGIEELYETSLVLAALSFAKNDSVLQ